MEEAILLTIKVASNLDFGLRKKKKFQDLRPNDKLSIILFP